MTTATENSHGRMALIFDFDLTLAPGTLDALVRRCGVDPRTWKRDHVEPLRKQGWDEILAKAYALAQLSRSGDVKITRDLVEEVGRDLDPYEGVPDMFESLRRTAREVTQDVGLEFYVVSSGLYDVMAATRIAREIDGLWGTKLHFDERTGELDFPMVTVTHPEKVRYILALCKGLEPTGPNAPAHVYQDVPDDTWHVPLDQVIYAGDGSSDMAVFRFLHDRGGLALGVYKSDEAEEWRGMEDVDPKRRVQNLAPTDYREGSELMRSLTLAVESIARKIALRQLSRGE
ncbi:HAD family hydrolase [Microvirga splendida]|uniref:Haloacid dehalogenase-like hydrolase n=1 Tax=Microvirga splendida TaxID=2795727 RepID=A0ABS0Y473_9HYPH|nr:HAD family hydrolase [Microvirga splendida]MBJ6127101.1 hypothetical protein [Microvirga splendida]